MDDYHGDGDADADAGAAATEEVLVIPIQDSSAMPGMLSETKVLGQETGSGANKQGASGAVFGAAGEEVIEKRTRFSLSHDQDSIGTCRSISSIPISSLPCPCNPLVFIGSPRSPVFNLGDMSPPGDILTFPRGHEVGYGVQKKYLV